MAREESNLVLWLFIVTGFSIIFYVTFYALSNGLFTTSNKLIEAKLELVAEEIDIKVSELVIGEDGQTFTTKDGEYKANFIEKNNDLQLRNLLKLNKVN